jgi:hypothetical protein
MTKCIKSAGRRQREPCKHDNSLPGRNANAAKRDLSSGFSLGNDPAENPDPPQGELNQRDDARSPHEGDFQLLPVAAAICRSLLAAVQNKTGRLLAPRLIQISQHLSSW